MHPVPYNVQFAYQILSEVPAHSKGMVVRVVEVVVVEVVVVEVVVDPLTKKLFKVVAELWFEFHS